MKYLLFFVLTAYDIVTGGCTSPSDKAIKKFNEINDSLKVANNTLVRRNSYEMKHLLIQEHDNADPQLVRHADSLYAATHIVLSYIERLKAQLMEADSIGDKTEPAAKLLLRTPASDSLRTMLLNVYTEAHKCFVGQDSIAQLEKAMVNIRDLRDPADWTPLFFKDAATVAAETVLAWYAMECTSAADLSLSTVLNQLRLH